MIKVCAQLPVLVYYTLRPLKCVGVSNFVYDGLALKTDFESDKPNLTDNFIGENIRC